MGRIELGWKESILTIFLALNAWNDLRRKKILLITVWIFGVAGIVLNICTGEMDMTTAAALLPGGLFLTISKTTNQAVGYGDGIVILVMGVYQGLWGTVNSVMIGLFLAALWAMGLTVFRKKKKQDNFAFLPFLLLGYLGGMWI